MQSLWLKVERFSAAVTPAALTAFMVLLTAVPLHIPGWGQVMPAFALISIYYWDTFCPGMLPYTFLLALGLLEDTLSGLPLGVSSAVNIVFAVLLLREHRNFGRAQFGAVWFGFALLSLMAMGFEWIIMSFYLGRMLPVGAQLLQWIATCFAYPLMHSLLTRVYRALMAS
jgi:rod shape-determining protein MreD